MIGRKFITLLGSGAVAWPLAAFGQVRRPLVGYLAGAAPASVIRSTTALAFVSKNRRPRMTIAGRFFRGRERAGAGLVAAWSRVRSLSSTTTARSSVITAQTASVGASPCGSRSSRKHIQYPTRDT
jgi:hypothetical protein